MPTRPAPAGKKYLCHARRRVRRGRAGQMRLNTYGRPTLARQDTAGSDGKAWDGFHSPHNQSSADENTRTPRNSVPRDAAFRVAFNMIVISESSAEATRPARTGRCVSACCCSSAARNDTPQYSDARSPRVIRSTEPSQRDQPRAACPIPATVGSWLPCSATVVGIVSVSVLSR